MPWLCSFLLISFFVSPWVPKCLAIVSATMNTLSRLSVLLSTSSSADIRFTLILFTCFGLSAIFLTYFVYVFIFLNFVRVNFSHLFL